MKSLARARDRDELLARLERVRPDTARRWGTMTAHQMVCHLTDAFRMVTGERSVRPPRERARAVVMKSLALYAPLRWPQGIPTTADLDQTREGTKPTAFAEDVAMLQQLLTRVASWQDCGGSIHPFFGSMSRAAWMRWGYLHVDHHLRQFGA